MRASTRNTVKVGERRDNLTPSALSNALHVVLLDAANTCDAQEKGRDSALRFLSSHLKRRSGETGCVTHTYTLTHSLTHALTQHALTNGASLNQILHAHVVDPLGRQHHVRAGLVDEKKLSVGGFAPRLFVWLALFWWEDASNNGARSMFMVTCSITEELTAVCSDQGLTGINHDAARTPPPRCTRTCYLHHHIDSLFHDVLLPVANGLQLRGICHHHLHTPLRQLPYTDRETIIHAHAGADVHLHTHSVCGRAHAQTYAKAPARRATF